VKVTQKVMLYSFSSFRMHWRKTKVYYSHNAMGWMTRVRFCQEEGFFSLPLCPGSLLGSFSLLSSEYWGLLPWR